MDLIKLSNEKGFLSKDKLISVNSEYYYLWMCELQKWLREAHNIDVYATWGTSYGNVVWYFYTSYIGIDSPMVSKEKFICYEEALEKGLQESI